MLNKCVPTMFSFDIAMSKLFSFSYLLVYIYQIYRLKVFGKPKTFFVWVLKNSKFYKDLIVRHLHKIKTTKKYKKSTNEILL